MVSTSAKGRLAIAAASIGALGAATLAYSLAEAKHYTLRTVDVPVLGADEPPMSILHISDLHLTPSQTGKREWVEGLAQLSPDFVVVTGDFLAHHDAVPAVLDALGPLLAVPGAFVLGSNDYYAPRVLNPFK